MHLKANKRILILAILFGLITVVALNYYLTSLDKPAMDSIPKTSVVVAKTTIPAHTRIQAEMLEVKTIPSEGVHPQALRSINEAVGGISRTEIVAGEQVLGQKIVTDDRPATLSYRIPEGMRAISIPVGVSDAVSGFISSGDSIDILISFEDVEVNQSLTTYTYFQNVKVLATGSETRERDTEEPVGANTLTLLVTPEQAEALVFVNFNTDLWLTLRSPLDENIVELDSYNFESFEAFRER